MNHSSSQAPRKFVILALLLLLEAALLFAFQLKENIPSPPDLEAVPSSLGDWTLQGSDVLDAATQAQLSPDASLMRSYRSEKFGRAAGLFIGYFKTTQPNHPVPHSPTVCLPGAGWKDIYQRGIVLNSAAGSFPLNEYVLAKGDKRLTVFFWYQNVERAWDSAVLSKLYMFPDFFRHRRSDVALVRVTLLTEDTPNIAIEPGKDFAAAIYPSVKQLFQATRGN